MEVGCLREILFIMTHGKNIQLLDIQLHEWKDAGCPGVMLMSSINVGCCLVVGCVVSREVYLSLLQLVLSREVPTVESVVDGTVFKLHKYVSFTIFL